MKTTVTLTILLATVSVSTSSYLAECFNYYKVDLSLYATPQGSDLPYDLSRLTPEHYGCMMACNFRWGGALKPDGTVDFMKLVEGEEPEKLISEKTRFEKQYSDCKSEFGTEECKVFACFNKKEEEWRKNGRGRGIQNSE